jgi:hypothetical protein
MSKAQELIIESKKHGAHTVLLDKEDWDKVSQYKWFLNRAHTGKLYVRANIDHPDGGTLMRKIGGKEYECKKQTTIALHQIIANTPKGMYTDHKNGDTLDNRKENLRICTNAQNCWNRGKNKNNSHGYKGIKFDGRRRLAPWQAYIGYHGKRIYIGNYATAEEAARAYDKKAIELYGEYAVLNFPTLAMMLKEVTQ